MKEGDPIALKYNPADPAEIHATRMEYLLFTVLVFCGTLLLISAYLVPRLLKKIRSKNTEDPFSR